MKAGLIVLGAAGAAVLLSGCGKPENSAYTSKSQDAAQMAALKTPLPSSPAWAAAVIGRPVSSIAKGQANCRGAVDVTLKHAAGGRTGDEIQGWAWDLQGKQAPVKILLTDPSAKVIGAGEINRDRPDVPKAVSDVKTSKVGYTLVTRSTAGVGSVVGVTSTGALCNIGAAQLS
jgi:hypothetical protein